MSSSIVSCLYLRHILGKFGVTRSTAVILDQTVVFEPAEERFHTIPDILHV